MPHGRFVSISRCRDKRSDCVAVPVAEGHDLVAFYLLVATEPNIVPAFFRRRRRAITMDRRDIQQVTLMQLYDLALLGFGPLQRLPA